MRRLTRLFLPLLALSLTLAHPALSVDCVDYAAYPQWKARIVTPGEASDVALSGNYAYIVEDPGAALRVVDISDLSHPVLLGSVALAAGAEAVVVDGDYAYVADGYGDLIVVVDITNPASPRVVGSIDATYRSFDVAVSAGYAYVANTVDLKIVDVSTPSSPVVVGSVPAQPSNAYAVALQGHYAYLAIGGGLRIIDINDPLNPSVVGSLDTGLGVNYSIAVRGDRVYLSANGAGSSGGRRIVDVSNPTAPVLLSSFGASGGGFGVAVDGDHACFSAGNFRGIEIVDIGDPLDPEFVTTLYTRPHTYGLTIRDGLLFAANGADGVRVASLSGISAVSITGRLDQGSALGVVPNSPHAYLATPDGMQVVDISVPSAPEVRGSLGGINGVRDIAATGDNVYLVSDGFWVVDASSPSSPTIAAALPLPYSGNGVAATGGFAFVATNYSLTVVDVRVPSSPVIVANTFLIWEEGVDVAVEEDIAYIVENDTLPPYDGGVLEIFDVTDPASPVWLAYEPLPWLSASVEATGGYVYVVGTETVAIFDGTTLVSTIPTLDRGSGVAIAGDHLYIADGLAGLQVVDISSPGNPMFVGTLGTPWVALDAAVDGGLVLIADSSCGLEIVPIQCPGATTVASGPPPSASFRVRPNPVSAATIIEWSGGANRARVRLYGPQGRQLVSRVMPAAGRLSWPELLGPLRLPAGVYFLELEAPGRRQSARVTVIP